MKLHEIENLSVAELKARRSELATAIANEPVQEIASRYIQARTDAKARDEKLAEQGKAIADLEKQLQSARNKSDEAKTILEHRTSQYRQQVSDLESRNAELEKALQGQKAG